MSMSTPHAGLAQQLVGQLAERGIVISALGYYPNPLDPDPATAAAAWSTHLRKVIDAAAPSSAWAWSTRSSAATDAAPMAENLRPAAGCWPALVAHAEAAGVKIGIENCPMLFSDDEWPGGKNLATSARPCGGGCSPSSPTRTSG